MSVTVKFTVASVHVIPVSTTVQMNGQDTTAIVDGCEVVMVDESNHSYTAVFVGSDCKDVRNRLTAGESISWTL